MTEPGFEVDYPRIEAAVSEILAAIGEDPERDGLVDTPARVARMYGEVCSGLTVDPDRHLAKTFDVEHDEMVMVRDIPMYSLCEHHLLPFFGKVHVAYIPDGRIMGISKAARLVETYARRFQVQERMTEQIAQALWEIIQPQGVGVIVEAYHLCMMMRGVQKQNSKTVTSAMRGIFLEDHRTRDEFLRLTTSAHQPLS